MAEDGLEILGDCPICGRPLVDGPSVDRHHWVPRSEGGGPASLVHVICHRMLHTRFSERGLAGAYATPEAVRADEDMQRFIRWVRKRPPEFIDWPRSPGRGRRRR